jgi:hypothetical protein
MKGHRQFQNPVIKHEMLELASVSEKTVQRNERGRQLRRPKEKPPEGRVLRPGVEHE